MDIALGDIVESKAGRDKGDIFVVLGREGDFAYIANGRNRKIDNQKKKRQKHLKVVKSSEFIVNKLRSGGKVTNVELRRELAWTAEGGSGSSPE